MLLIGVTTLFASLVLAFLSIISFGGLGLLCLSLTCLFGVVASIQFLRGQSVQGLVVALLLGGGVAIVTLIVMPIVVANSVAASSGKMALPPPEDAGSDGLSDAPEMEAAVHTDEEGAPIVSPIVAKIDMTKVVWGVILVFADAFLLLMISTPPVQRYFHPRRTNTDTGVIKL